MGKRPFCGHFPELKNRIQLLFFSGQDIAYNADDPAAARLLMFGFVKAENGTLQMANRIFETWLYNYFLAQPEEQVGVRKITIGDKVLVEAVV